MSTPTEHLQQTTANLQSKLTDERRFYEAQKAAFSVFYPDQWVVVGSALIAIAYYYKAEIVRARNDLADWMQGHDVHSTYGKSEIINEIHWYIMEMMKLLEEYGKNKANGNEKEAETSLHEATGAIESLQDLTKAIQEETYAGR